MLGVASVGARDGTFTDGESENVNKTPVITSGESVSGFVDVGTVNVSSIGSTGEDTLSGPGEVHGLGSPVSALSVGSSGGVLLDVRDGPEQELVVTRVSSDVGAVSRPVKAVDIGGVSSALANEAEVIRSVVDIEGVVVRANSQVSVAGGEGHALNPLRGVLEQLALTHVARVGTDGNGTIVTSNGKPVSVAADGTRALRVRQGGKSGGTTTLGLDRSLRDLVRLELLAVVEVPEDNLVVVTGGDNGSLGNVGESPNFTFAVRVHDRGLLLRVAVDAVDGTVAETNKEGLVEAVNSTDEVSEAESLDNSHGGSVNHVNASVLATGEEVAVGPADRADEALAVEVVGAIALTALPDVELGVSTTSVASAIGVVGHAGEGGHGVVTEKTLLLVAGLSVPEVEMLGTSSGEGSGTRLGGEAHIVDLVGVTLLLGHESASLSVEHVQVMLVVEINGSDEGTALGDGNGGDTSASLGELETVELLTSAGVPGEHDGGGSNLTGDGDLSLGADLDGHDVVGVLVLVVSNLLGGVVDFASTEEFLGVGGNIKNNTNGSSHVSGLLVLVPVHVLARVSASVAVHVLKLVLGVRLGGVHIVVSGRLDDLAEPGTASTELLSRAGFGSSEVVDLGTVGLVQFAVFGRASFLVVDLSLSAGFGEEGVVVLKSFGRLQGETSIR